MTGDAVEFCRYAAMQVVSLHKGTSGCDAKPHARASLAFARTLPAWASKARAVGHARPRREPPSLDKLSSMCGMVSAAKWDEFEPLFERTTCNEFCVKRGLAPWKADDYVMTKPPLVYEELCKGRRALMSTVRWPTHQHEDMISIRRSVLRNCSGHDGTLPGDGLILMQPPWCVWLRRSAEV
jgi:hypothetical protein